MLEIIPEPSSDKWYTMPRRSFVNGSVGFQIKRNPDKVKVLEISDDPVDLDNFLSDTGLADTHRDAASRSKVESYLTSHDWWFQVYGGAAGDGVFLMKAGFRMGQVYSRTELKKSKTDQIENALIEKARQGGFKVNPEKRQGTPKGDTNVDDFDDALSSLGIKGFRYVRVDAVRNPVEEEKKKDKTAGEGSGNDKQETVKDEKPQDQGLSKRQLQMAGVVVLGGVALWLLS